MSKNKQRRASAYAQGIADRRNGHPVRWVGHPFIKEYRNGYFSKHNNMTTNLSGLGKIRILTQKISILCWCLGFAYTTLIVIVAFIIFYIAAYM